jgi:hypothetical protein
MLAPHDGENPQLGEVWFAPENLPDPLTFFRGQSVLRDDFGRDFGFSGDHGKRTVKAPRRSAIANGKPLPAIA